MSETERAAYIRGLAANRDGEPCEAWSYRTDEEQLAYIKGWNAFGRERLEADQTAQACA